MGTAVNRLLDRLTHEERVARYRQFAEHALHAASRTSDPDLRSGYLRIAIGWETLSEEVSKRQAMLSSPQLGALPKSASRH